jgi:hypothetical protein
VTLDRVLGRFFTKNLVAVFSAVLCVGACRYWLPAPDTTVQDFNFLCLACGFGSVVYLATLAALRALPLTQLALLWSSENASRGNLDS